MQAKFEAEAIKHYIEKYGFGVPTPPLCMSLSPDIFRQHYYDKKTLVTFCRAIGLPVSGQKNDLNHRIELYLRTGEILEATHKKMTTKPDSETGLSLDKQVVFYKSDVVTRQFFEKYIPEFSGFSALVQKTLKERLANNEYITYGELIDMHKDFLKNKRIAKESGEITKVAHDSCQYNQFFIDYSHDPEAKVYTAKEAWLLVRNSAGEKTYEAYKEKIEAIRKIVISNRAS